MKQIVPNRFAHFSRLFFTVNDEVDNYNLNPIMHNYQEKKAQEKGKQLSSEYSGKESPPTIHSPGPRLVLLFKGFLSAQNLSLLSASEYVFP